MRRVLLIVLAGGLAGCSLIFSGDDLKADGGTRDANLTDARVPMDGGRDGGAEAGPPDAGPPDAGPPCTTDADDDGFFASSCGGTDCDDDNAAVGPGVPMCDSGFTDCDSFVLGRTLQLLDDSSDTVSELDHNRLAAALTRWTSDASSHRLAVALPVAPGYSVSIGPVHSSTLALSAIGNSMCFGDATHAALATGDSQTNVFFTLARSTTSGEGLMQAFQVEEDGAFTFDGCIQSPASAVTVEGAAVLESPTGAPVPAAFGGVAMTGAVRGCLAVGGQQCEGGRIGGTERIEHGGSMERMVFGAVGAVVHYRSSTGSTGVLADMRSSPTGRMAAAHQGADALLVSPAEGGRVVLAPFQCTDTLCSAREGETPPEGTILTGVLPDRAEDPLLALTTLTDDASEFLLAFRSPDGVSFARVIGSGEGPVISAPVTLPALQLAASGLVALDLAVLRAPGQNTIVLVVLAGPTLTSNATTLLRFSFTLCELAE